MLCRCQNIVDKLLLSVVIVLVAAHSTSAQSDLSQRAQIANEYYVNGEFAKALDIYQELAKKDSAIPLIHSNYFDYLLKQKEFKAAEKYIYKVMKAYPREKNYKADFVYLFEVAEEKQKKQQALGEIIDLYQGSSYQLKLLADNLVNKNLLTEALTAYREARKTSRNPAAYALDMAGLYRQLDKKKQMTEEYLLYAVINQRNTRYIKNVFQQLLSEPEDLDYLEQTLITKLQDNPGNQLYLELIIWVEIQRRNYYGAFIQARALDKRLQTYGRETMAIGRIALDNEAWLDAVDIFEYVVDEYGKGSPYYTSARQLLIEAKEGKVINTFPIDRINIKSLSREYQALYDEFGPGAATLTALRNKARLQAFYLDEKRAALKTLQQIVDIPGVEANIRDRAKLDLGDIYLLINEPWEATLLYSQVEKSNKYDQLNYLSKLKNARLNYYMGNFALAKSHLDVLKNATTKKIANDALDLSVLIKNNTILDTTDQVMQQYADIDLLMYQKKSDSALIQFKKFLKKYPGHSLEDEVLWQISNIYLEKGQYQQSLNYLDKLLTSYGFDILADDASYMRAEITDSYLENPDKASELYYRFMTEFPGSIYAAEARKRYRELRGDNIN